MTVEMKRERERERERRLRGVVVRSEAQRSGETDRRRKDLVTLASPVRIPMWDVGAGPLDEIV
jgi:hypothetical protein